MNTIEPMTRVLEIDIDFSMYENIYPFVAADTSYDRSYSIMTWNAVSQPYIFISRIPEMDSPINLIL